MPRKIWESPWLQVALIVVLTIIAYLPALNAGFIWDDDSHLTQNPCIIGPLGFKEIWISSHAYYYPLVLTTFWVLHKFVGLNPLPYHVLNVLMHAGSAVLLWRVLQQLKVRGAWFGAALWALHPVMVESVAWITELKNTQSCFFYLLSILFFLKVDSANSEPQERRWRFCLSLLFFAMAITSKSSTVMLPVVLGLCLWWRRSSVNCPSGSDRLHWRDLVQLAPFLFISAAASGWTIWEQKFHSGALGVEFTQNWPQRFAIAGRDIWFYLEKLVWPDSLAFIYPRWEIDIFQAKAFLPFFAAAILLSLLYRKRDTRLRPVVFAAAYFVVSLFPVLGFFNVYFFRYSFVSDHFQYLASIGPLALAASGIVTALQPLEKIIPPRWVQPVLCGLLLLVLGILTWRQTEGYHDVETLWRTTIARNPDCPLAHLNLGVLLKERGQRDEAKAEYLEALKVNPGYAEALTTLGVCEAEERQFEKAISSFEAALKSDPTYSPAWYNMGNAFRDEGKSDEAIASYQTALQMWSENQEAHNNLAVALSQSGKQEEAIAHFREALRLKPNDAGAHNNLGVVLTQQGQLDDAVDQFKEALRLNRTSIQTYINLARALVRLGRRDEAVQNLKEALRLKPDSVEARQQLRDLGADF